MRIEVFLKGKNITVKRTTQTEFPFVIKADGQSCSYIAYDKGRYYLCNRRGKVIDRRKISPSEVKEIIRETIMAR